MRQEGTSTIRRRERMATLEKRRGCLPLEKGRMKNEHEGGRKEELRWGNLEDNGEKSENKSTISSCRGRMQ